jgi:hypothetical protein
MPRRFRALEGTMIDRPERYKPSPKAGKSAAGFDCAIHFVRAAYVPSSGASDDGVFGKTKNIMTRAKNEAATIAQSFSWSVRNFSALITISFLNKTN